MEHIAKTGWLELAKELGDESEAGQDYAAKLQATARRVMTEDRVAGKSVRRVLVLDGWREALSRWESLELQIVMMHECGERCGHTWPRGMERCWKSFWTA